MDYLFTGIMPDEVVYFENLFKLYDEGKYLEMNLLEVADRANGISNLFSLLYDNSISFYFKPFMFGKPKRRAINSDMIVFYKHKLKPKQ